MARSRPNKSPEASPSAPVSEPPVGKRKSVKKVPAPIDSACEDALMLLQRLSIDPQLQADLKWCLGSYRNDQNPVGLVRFGAKALEGLRAARATNAKAVPAKVISSLEAALQQG